MTASLNDPTLLHNSPLFKSLSDNDLLNIINAPENGIEEYGTRETIVRESEIGDAMYIILDGYVEVTIRSSSSDREVGIATLKPGDFFGEQSLLPWGTGRRNASDREVGIATLKPGDFFGDQSLLPWGTGRRNASVRALHSAKVFRIDKKYVLLSIKHDDEELEDSDSADITSLWAW
jgi:CRP-like cAMP-binding protein